VIHVQYTARDGGGNFRVTVKDHLINALNDMVVEDDKTGLFRLFSIKREFPNEWHQFLYPTESVQKMELDLSEERFPFQFRGKITEIKWQKLFLKLKDDTSEADLGSFEIDIASIKTISEKDFSAAFEEPCKLLEATLDITKEFGIWLLKVTEGTLAPDDIEDMGILCSYSI